MTDNEKELEAAMKRLKIESVTAIGKIFEAVTPVIHEFGTALKLVMRVAQDKKRGASE